MNDAIKAVKEKGLTKIRQFTIDDMGLMYDECKKGRLPVPKETSAEQFFTELKQVIAVHTSHWIVEDSGEAVAAMFIRSDGWTMEPHVEFFKDIKPVQIYRSYITFFGSLKEQEFEGSCIVKTREKEKPIFNKLVKQKVLKYVGDIPNGDPSGETVFLYCQPKFDKGAS